MYKKNRASISISREDKNISALKLLFKQHLKIYEFLIHPKTLCLRNDPEILFKNAEGFSSGEKIMIQIGLDLCFHASHSCLWDAVNRLDVDNFQNVIKTLIYLRMEQK